MFLSMYDNLQEAFSAMHIVVAQFLGCCVFKMLHYILQSVCINILLLTKLTLSASWHFGKKAL